MRPEILEFQALPIAHDVLGLDWRGWNGVSYFCTPMEAEILGGPGVDGIHFILLPGDERVYCVDPAMGEQDTYVLPVAPNLRTFVSYVLFCRDANPISQLHWMTEAQYRQLLTEAEAAQWEGCEAFFERQRQALDVLARVYGVGPADPFESVKTMQAEFVPTQIRFSDQYYDVLGIERP